MSDTHATVPIASSMRSFRSTQRNVYGNWNPATRPTNNP